MFVLYYYTENNQWYYTNNNSSAEILKTLKSQNFSKINENFVDLTNIFVVSKKNVVL